MRTSFDDLRLLLDAVEHWLPHARSRLLTSAERKLIDTLTAYLAQCRDDQARVWKSAKAADRAISKINRTWPPLWQRLLDRGAR